VPECYLFDRSNYWETKLLPSVSKEGRADSGFGKVDAGPGKRLPG